MPDPFPSPLMNEVYKMRLEEVTIHKYKCFENDQTFKVEKDITILVGMNESGKTAILEAIAKANYFRKDNDFKFNKTHDYPRREKKKMDKSGETPSAITLKYSISDDLLKHIESDLGKGVFTQTKFSISKKYDNETTFNDLNADKEKFIKNKFDEFGIKSKDIYQRLLEVNNPDEFKEFIQTIQENKDESQNEVSASNEDGEELQQLESLKKYFENQWKWQNPIQVYIARNYLEPKIPKFLYYDEYYLLPSRISIEKIVNDKLDEDLEIEKAKTAKALFELAELDPKEILEANDFEDFIAELEATEAIISDELFKYWTTNKNLNIEFRIDKVEKTEKRSIHPNNQIIDVKIIEHYLDIRVKNQRVRVSLPLRNRSKGFNWFFSFLVWFKKIQEDKNSQYILLLDEPGLNLHASAQADMLKFMEDLSKDYQIIYTTHSPFSIPSDKLHRVRTVLETNSGSVISESIQEKDPKTLFPLQAALGYDIAQNLFISKKNLLVEGISDLIYLQTISGILESERREHLSNNITIVPTGGLDKVATFISLLRGNKLDMLCLLDTPTDSKGKARIDDMIKQKLIKEKKIRYFHEFIDGFTQADIEDLFVKEDYLKLFNNAFPEYDDLTIDDLNDKIKPIIIQINKALGIERFNHYRPANELLKRGLNSDDFDSQTIDNFEKVIVEINKLFGKAEGSGIENRI